MRDEFYLKMALDKHQKKLILLHGDRIYLIYLQSFCLNLFKKDISMINRMTKPAIVLQYLCHKYSQLRDHSFNT